MILLIDNYDSFTYIIRQYLIELGQEVVVWKHDAYPLNAINGAIDDLNPTKIVLSPGPGAPVDAGMSLAVIDRYHASLPMLGVCLGHQCLGQYFGGTISRAPTIKHGKTSAISHDGSTLFANIPSPFQVTRYHSLIISPDSIPAVFRQTAWVDEGAVRICMAIEHTRFPLFGVQFHPESYLSEHGYQLFENFLSV